MHRWLLDAHVSFTQYDRERFASLYPKENMSKAPTIQYAKVDDLDLDPTNPRLGRRVASPDLTQGKILKVMEAWTLDEIATSFLESGFFPQEAVIVVEEELYGKPALVVVEGNRRLATAKLLKDAVDGKPASRRWKEIAESGKLPEDFFDKIPYIKVASRREVSAYLGFRHVTGIKEWKPAEKAQYIAKLIEDEGLSYDEVRRKIGSKAPTVRQHYISYRLLLQMDDSDAIDVEKVENKFSVLYLSLRTVGVQKYLHVDMLSPPELARSPVPEEQRQNLVNFAKWVFGDEKSDPLFSDSRQVDTFGKVLESDEAVNYLERSKNASFEMAIRMSGAGEDSVIDYVRTASDNVQLALAEAHVFKRSVLLQKAVDRLGIDVLQLLSIFPAVKAELLKSETLDAGAS
ncbi:MAG: hypothetical protein EON54_01000 [Alcaligenaceae bacterium]|nr:MAG: hypothetical protein EON54_01000 [Alcaligenaceae bacterium]